MFRDFFRWKEKRIASKSRSFGIERWKKRLRGKIRLHSKNSLNKRFAQLHTTFEITNESAKLTFCYGEENTSVDYTKDTFRRLVRSNWLILNIFNASSCGLFNSSLFFRLTTRWKDKQRPKESAERGQCHFDVFRSVVFA